MKVSFDLDGTLDNETIFELFKMLRYPYNTKYIVSYRSDIPSDAIYSNYITTVYSCNIHLLGNMHKTKLEVLVENWIDLHFDDDPVTVAEINNYAEDNNLSLRAVLVNHKILIQTGT